MTRELTTEQLGFEVRMGIRVEWPDTPASELPILIPMSDTDLLDRVHLIMGNFPEYTPEWAQCTSYMYAPEWVIEIWDKEDEQYHTLTEANLVYGFKMYIQGGYKEARDKWKWLVRVMDPSYHDAEFTDHLVQLALFDEVIYD